MNAKVSNLQASYVLAYGVSERKDGPIIALKYDREDASNWIVSASSEYRNQQMPGPSYHIVELIDRTAAVSVEALEGLLPRAVDALRRPQDYSAMVRKRIADELTQLIKERING